MMPLSVIFRKPALYFHTKFQTAMGAWEDTGNQYVIVQRVIFINKYLFFEKKKQKFENLTYSIS